MPSNGSRAPVPHSAQAGVVNESDPRTFYPFCGANDFAADDEYPTPDAAKAHPALMEHVAQNA